MNLRTTIAAVAVLGLSPALARADVVTYDLAGSVTDSVVPSNSGTYAAVVSLDTTQSPTFNGFSDPSYAFRLSIQSFTINGVSPSLASSQYGYLQVANRGSPYPQAAEFRFYPSDYSSGYEFDFAYPFTPSNIGVIQPLPDLSGTLVVSDFNGLPTHSSGTATLTVVPEPSSLAMLVVPVGATSWLARRRRRCSSAQPAAA